MLDHLTLHVKDIDRSITFYKQALAPLGYIVKAHHEPTLGFGVDDGTLHSDFYVSPIEGLEAEASPVTPVTHIAFLADSQQAVQAFHAAALAAGGRDNGAATNTASTTLTITLPDGLSADNRTRLCWQTAGWLVTHARQYGIDALHADGMDWNRKAGTWIGTETAEQTITFTLA